MNLTEMKGPKRGVALYSYSGEFGVSMNLEDCFADMRDMGVSCWTNTELCPQSMVTGSTPACMRDGS